MSYFVDFLNEAFGGVGTFVAILIFLCGAAYKWYKEAKTMEEERKGKYQEEFQKEKEDQDYKELIGKISNSIDNMKEELAKISSSQEAHNQEIEKKFTEFWSQLEKQDRESKQRDEVQDNKLLSFQQTIGNLEHKLDLINAKETLLIESDKESIKSFIVTTYYTARNRGYLEPYLLEAVEHRYEKYLQENGNTFVEDLVLEMRKMPKEPPESD